MILGGSRCPNMFIWSDFPNSPLPGLPLADMGMFLIDEIPGMVEISNNVFFSTTAWIQFFFFAVY